MFGLAGESTHAGGGHLIECQEMLGSSLRRQRCCVLRRHDIRFLHTVWHNRATSKCALHWRIVLVRRNRMFLASENEVASAGSGVGTAVPSRDADRDHRSGSDAPRSCLSVGARAEVGNLEQIGKDKEATRQVVEHAQDAVVVSGPAGAAEHGGADALRV